MPILIGGGNRVRNAFVQNIDRVQQNGKNMARAEENMFGHYLRRFYFAQTVFFFWLGLNGTQNNGKQRT
jgi:hypothetical protein